MAERTRGALQITQQASRDIDLNARSDEDGQLGGADVEIFDEADRSNHGHIQDVGTQFYRRVACSEPEISR